MLLNQGNSAPATAVDSFVIETTTQTFVKEVIEESRRQPVLVDFWAPWCGPCKTLGPVIEKIVKTAKGKIKLAKMNIDKHPQVAQQLGIQSIPAVFAFVNGQPVDGFVGALPEGQVKAFIDRLVGESGGDTAELIRQAEQTLIAGDAVKAAEIFANLLSEEPENVQALVGLVRCHVAAGNLEPARQTLALIPKAKENDPLVSAARTALKLSEQAKNVDDVATLEARVAVNPLDHQARFDFAVALNFKGNRRKALDQLIEIIKRDRKWNDDGARKQLVQFFEAWGSSDENTIEGRRQLSLILFS
jgi:putative thioredoxin